MRDFVNSRSSSSDVGASRKDDPSPGKATLVDGLRGIEASASAPASSPVPEATRGMAGGSRLDAIFGDVLRGLKGGPPGEREAVRGGGDSAGPAAGPAAPDAGAATPAAPAAPAPAPTPAVTITSTTNAGPTFGPNGAAMWHVAFTTTGRTGWIVQKIDNTVTGTDAAGSPMTPASIGLAPHYYEAWSVDAAGAVTPSVGGDNDHWDQGSMGDRTKGSWSTTGDLYWVAGAARPGGMAARAVPNAGMLVSSYTAPPGLGSALLHRYARATWDATVTPPVDTGTAA
jgi:hypothetical protein